MGLGMLAFSAIFLCNPMIGFVDILPDCIGFLLLCNGLNLMADMSERLADARRRFQILFWAGLIQILAELFLYNFMQSNQAEMNPYEMPVTILTFSFIWAVLYCAVLIPALRNLFLGLDRMGERFGFSGYPSSSSKTMGERMARRSTVFVIALTVLGMLPELSILTSFEHDKGSKIFLFDWYDFIGLFRWGAFFLASIFSAIWLISCLRYFHRLQKDKRWIDSMREYYTAEVLPQVGMLSVRRFTSAFLILYVAILFAIHLKMSYFSCLPGIVFAFLVFAGLSSLGDLLPKQKHCNTAAIALAVCSLTELIVNYFYLKKYIPEESLFIPSAFWHYFAVQALDIIEILLTLVLFYFLSQAIREIIKNYTGVQYAGTSGQALSQSATQKLHKSFFLRLNIIFVLFFVAAIGNIADTVLHFYVGWLWLIPLCVSIVGVLLYHSLQHDLLEEIRFHYQSEREDSNRK